VKSSIEPLEGNKVKVYVEVDEAEFDRDIDRAFRAIAREIKMPGFRNGKVPRKVLEARIGIGPAREQALRDAVPEYLAKAVREHDVDLIATPEVEITAGQDEGPIEFDATCEVRPEITVPGYGGLRIELPSPVVDAAELDEAIDQERRRSASLETIDRAVESGDFVVLDLVATRDGEEVAGLNTQDWSYEVGQGWITDDFDSHLIGVSAGDTLSFTSTPKGTEEPADFTVNVTAVQQLVLADLTDEWVADNFGEYDSVEAWQEDLAERLSEAKLNQARSQVVAKMTTALAQLVEIDAPESMVNSDLQSRVQRTAQQFQAQGIDLQAWLSATGQGTDAFIESMREQSEQAVKIDLALRAVAAAEGIEVDDAEIEAEYARVAMQVGQKARQVRLAYERNDAVPELIAQIRKSKALDWLLHHVEMVDPEGHPLDADLILGHDHDHGEHGHGDHADHADGDHDHAEHGHGDHDEAGHDEHDDELDDKRGDAG